MRLLFLSSYYPPHAKGGAELSTKYLAEGLRQLGHDVSVLTDGSQKREGVIGNVEVKYLPLKLTAKPLLEARHAQRIARYIAVNVALSDYDIIHAHDFRTALAVAQLSHPHKVVTIRDYAQICGSTNYMGVNGGPCPGCTWRAVWGNHRVAEAAWPRKVFRAWQYVHNLPYRQSAFARLPNHVYISHAQQSIIRDIQPLPTVAQTVIYNPVAPEYCQAPIISPPTRDLLYVGTVETYKGVELLLDAFHAIALDYPEVQLKIVGEGADRSRLERKVSQWGLQYRISFTGRIAPDNLQPHYDAARIVIAPHIWAEPFGRTVVEAMARGRLVITANRGGPTEIVQHQKNGLLFAAGNAEALVMQLRKGIELRDLDYREMTEAAHDWVRRHLSAEHIAQLYHAWYTKLTQ